MELIVSPGYSTPIQDRVTAPEPPGYMGTSDAALEAAYWYLGYSEAYHEERITETAAMMYSAFWACVNAITHSICSVGWHVFERSGENRTKLELSDNIAWLLDMQTNPETGAIDWRECVLRDALVLGNGYAEIEKDGFERVRWLWQLDNSRVTPERDESGELIYKVDNGKGNEPSYLTPDRVFHLKGMGPDGIVGYSVLDYARKTLDLAISEDAFGRNFFKRGPTPGGVLELPGALRNPEQMRGYRNEFEKAYAGKQNTGRVLVTSGGMKFTAYDLPNTDAQLLESRKFSRTDICRFFRVPPHKIFDLERATFSNIEEQNIEYVVDCLLYWARKLEAEADLKLFGRTQRGTRFTRLNLGALMRGNTQAQTEMVSKQVAAGVLTPDEGREYLDRNPYPGGIGKEPLVQGALKTLEQVLEPPEPPAPAAPPPNQNGQQDGQQQDGNQDEPPADVAATFTELIAEAYMRFGRVQFDKAKRAKTQGKLAAHLDTFYKDIDPIIKDLGPLFRGFAYLAAKPLPSDEIIAARARNYVDTVRACVESCGPEALKELDRVALARNDLAFLWTGSNGHA